MRTKNKIGFLDTILARLAENNLLSCAWDKCNIMVMTWMPNSIEGDISQSIPLMDASHDIWVELRDHYHQANVFWIFDLQEYIFSLSLRQWDQPTNKYYTMLKKLWQELENFQPLITYSCMAKSACNLLPTIKQYKKN